MNTIRTTATIVRFESNEYPAEHWNEVRRFLYGDEYDPKNLFRLSDDMWDAWPYAAHGRPSEKRKYRFRFGPLRSWLKPYVKRYCYLLLLGRGQAITKSAAAIPEILAPVDQFMIEHQINSLEELALPTVFEAVWEAHLRIKPGEVLGSIVPEAVVARQTKVRSFWVELSLTFGSPKYVPPIAPRVRNIPARAGADQSKIIPLPVIRQLVNKLALHRDGISLLSRYHHLRLCILIVIICTGRRIDEVLSTPRGAGPDGPLERYPCRDGDGEPSDALWFRFLPNKSGITDLVYISPEWEDIAAYCVRQIIRYSDEVRGFAVTGEQDLLILISWCNWTAGCKANDSHVPGALEDFTEEGLRNWSEWRRSFFDAKKNAAGLSYEKFRSWLIGHHQNSETLSKNLGVMHNWHITTDGTSEGGIYNLCTSHARHTRQSALARDPQVPLLARQRDLNHADPDQQLAYQHVLDEQNRQLLDKVIESPMMRNFRHVFANVLGSGEDSEGLVVHAQYMPGAVSLMTPRWRKLIEHNASYVKKNMVDHGICETSLGPDGCSPYRESGRGRDGLDVLRKMEARKPRHKVEIREGSAAPAPVIEQSEVKATQASPVGQRGHRRSRSKEVIGKLRKRLEQLEEG